MPGEMFPQKQLKVVRIFTMASVFVLNQRSAGCLYERPPTGIIMAAATRYVGVCAAFCARHRAPPLRHNPEVERLVFALDQCARAVLILGSGGARDPTRFHNAAFERSAAAFILQRLSIAGRQCRPLADAPRVPCWMLSEQPGPRGCACQRSDCAESQRRSVALASQRDR